MTPILYGNFLRFRYSLLVYFYSRYMFSPNTKEAMGRLRMSLDQLFMYEKTPVMLRDGYIKVRDLLSQFGQEPAPSTAANPSD